MEEADGPTKPPAIGSCMAGYVAARTCPACPGLPPASWHRKKEMFNVGFGMGMTGGVFLHRCGLCECECETCAAYEVLSVVVVG